jgi:hypothetical protein
MALVSYSDSEGSDSENQTQNPQPSTAKKESSTVSAAEPFKPSKPAPGFSSLVDRRNPRKIRVALPEIKPEDGTGEEEDGAPARKKPRMNGGGMFSGFNSLLPPPKRTTQNAAAEDKKTGGVGRKAFSLKTGANPGFDRQGDAEMRHEQALNESAGPPAGGSLDDTTIQKPGSLRDDGGNDSGLLKEGEYKKKGNAMLFKPLSVARNPQKKKSPSMIAASRAAADGVDQKKKGSAAITTASASGPSPSPASDAASAAPPAKPKVSLFSFSSEEISTNPADTVQDPVQSSSGTYESLLYNPSEADPSPGSQIEPSFLDPYAQQPAAEPSSSTASSSQPTLDTIADDLNLSRSQRRQLLGRNPQAAKSSRVLTFHTDAEYTANQELLNRTTAEEMAAAQHNPVRAIAPGKHTLRQLVSAATSQRDALEESFAAGRRNKKEAGSRYGW